MNNEPDSSKSSFLLPLSEDTKTTFSPCDLIATGYTSPNSNLSSPSAYQKLPSPKDTFLAYIVAIRDPLNFHLDIYWSDKIAKRYSNALNYEYAFVSEELSPQIYRRTAYSCHLKGVEIISPEPNDFSNMKEAYIFMSKRIAKSGGWVLVSVGDIDIYQRVLINMFDIITRKSLNYKLLNKTSERTGQSIAQEYIRPYRKSNTFLPSPNTLPKDYHIIFNDSTCLSNKNFEQSKNAWNNVSLSSNKNKLPNSLI